MKVPKSHFARFMRLFLLVLLPLCLNAETMRVRVWVTFYCPCEKCTGKKPGQRGYGLTSTQKRVTGVPFRRSGGTPHYGIAADPSVIPYGSLVRFEGYTVSEFYPADYAWPVDDTGGDMKKAWRRPWEHPRVKDGTIPNQRFIALDFRTRTHAGALMLARKHGGWQWVTIIVPARLAHNIP